MIVYCLNCGKKCHTKPIKVERGEVNPEKFYCHQCNMHLHKHTQPDMTIQRNLNYAATFNNKEEHQ